MVQRTFDVLSAIGFGGAIVGTTFAVTRHWSVAMPAMLLATAATGLALLVLTVRINDV
jgi:hypothetical protein